LDSAPYSRPCKARRCTLHPFQQAELLEHAQRMEYDQCWTGHARGTFSPTADKKRRYSLHSRGRFVLARVHCSERHTKRHKQGSSCALYAPPGGHIQKGQRQRWLWDHLSPPRACRCVAVDDPFPQYASALRIRAAFLNVGERFKEPLQTDPGGLCTAQGGHGTRNIP
jgi:hypothetical protein